MIVSSSKDPYRSGLPSRSQSPAMLVSMAGAAIAVVDLVADVDPAARGDARAAIASADLLADVDRSSRARRAANSATLGTAAVAGWAAAGWAAVGAAAAGWAAVSCSGSEDQRRGRYGRRSDHHLATVVSAATRSIGSDRG